MPLPLSVFQGRVSRNFTSSGINLDDHSIQSSVDNSDETDQRQLFPSISDVTRIYRQLMSGASAYTSLPSLSWTIASGTRSEQDPTDSNFASLSDDTYPNPESSVFRIPRPRFQSNSGNNTYRRRLLELFRSSERNQNEQSSNQDRTIGIVVNDNSSSASDLNANDQNNQNIRSSGYHGIPLTNFFPAIRSYFPGNTAMDNHASDLEHWSSVIRSNSSAASPPPLPLNIHRRQYSANTQLYLGQQHSDSQSPKKSVYLLHCSYCSKFVCHRGMKATLLANTSIHLYSTDAPPPNSVHLMEEDYCTSSCQCQLRDVGCLGCGNIIGYHVTQPCSSCMSSSNNGHFWMFHSQGVYAQMRVDGLKRPITWNQLYGHFIHRGNTRNNLDPSYCYMDLSVTAAANTNPKMIDARPYMYDDGYHLYDGNNISDKHSKWIPPYEDFCR